MTREPFSRLETERLILRRFRDDDLGAVVAYRSDPEVARFQAWEAMDAPSVRAFIAAVRDREPGAPGEWFQFALEERASGVLVGDCGLRTDNDARLGEVGFSLARAHQGKGYATEAVRAVLGYAFDALGMHRVVGNCDARNLASARVMERAGMRREAHHLEDYWSKGEWTSSFIYAALAREWREGSRGA